MRRVVWIVVGSVVVLMHGLGWAETYTPTGTVVEASYTEPTTNKTGTPLADLGKTTVYYDLGAGPVAAVETPASAATGGGSKTVTVTVPIGPDQEADVRFWVTATDTSGNQSEPSPGATKRLDRLAPAPPQ